MTVPGPQGRPPQHPPAGFRVPSSSGRGAGTISGSGAACAMSTVAMAGVKDATDAESGRVAAAAAAGCGAAQQSTPGGTSHVTQAAAAFQAPGVVSPQGKRQVRVAPVGGGNGVPPGSGQETRRGAVGGGGIKKTETALFLMKKGACQGGADPGAGIGARCRLGPQARAWSVRGCVGEGGSLRAGAGERRCVELAPLFSRSRSHQLFLFYIFAPPAALRAPRLPLS